jgi:hypothetical protein
MLTIGSRVANGMFLTAGGNRNVFYCTTLCVTRVTWPFPTPKLMAHGRCWFRSTAAASPKAVAGPGGTGWQEARWRIPSTTASPVMIRYLVRGSRGSSTQLAGSRLRRSSRSVIAAVDDTLMEVVG